MTIDTIEEARALCTEQHRARASNSQRVRMADRSEAEQRAHQEELRQRKIEQRDARLKRLADDKAKRRAASAANAEERKRVSLMAREEKERQARAVAAVERQLRGLIVLDKARSEVAACPYVQQLQAILRTPAYIYDPSPEAQSVVVEAIFAIPTHVRRSCFGLPHRDDPLYPIVSAIASNGRMKRVTTEGRDFWSESDVTIGSFEVIAAIYGMTRQRVGLLEQKALRKLRARADVQKLRCFLDEDAEFIPNHRVRAA